MKKKNLDNSIEKWNKDLWKEMIESASKVEDYFKIFKVVDPTETDRKKMAWYKVVWDGCGFCAEFNGICELCPLYSRHCSKSLNYCIRNKNIMGKLHNYWLNNEEEKFRKLQEEFLEYLKTF